MSPSWCVLSAVFSGGAGGARAPPELRGSEKGQSLISAYRSLAITTNTPGFKKLNTALYSDKFYLLHNKQSLSLSVLHSRQVFISIQITKRDLMLDRTCYLPPSLNLFPTDPPYFPKQTPKFFFNSIRTCCGVFWGSQYTRVFETRVNWPSCQQNLVFQKINVR